MKIKKVIKSKIKRDYFFITGSLKDIDSNYFISKINEGVTLGSNLNYKTNVIGQQTSFDFFCKDKFFIEIILKLVDYLHKNKIVYEQEYSLCDAWGVKEGFKDYSKIHHHLPHYISGIIYLNNHPQKLYFPEIKEEVKPQLGGFVLFSSFLNHYNNENKTNKYKYAISFNFEYLTILQQS
tara:strand:+ start:55 stop:594 length:540 start_codon:yes stop_codon:yes gene_type:complete